MTTIVDCYDPCQALPPCKLEPFTPPCICQVTETQRQEPAEEPATQTTQPPTPPPAAGE